MKKTHLGLIPMHLAGFGEVSVPLKRAKQLKSLEKDLRISFSWDFEHPAPSGSIKMPSKPPRTI